MKSEKTWLNESWANNCQFFEYTSAANPQMPKINVKSFAPELHQINETKIIPLDLSETMKTDFPCTGPNLLANFIHINADEKLNTHSHASSQVFFVIRGKGHSQFEEGDLAWKTGDFFALPVSEKITHHADEDSAFYWVHDAPLLDFLGARSQTKRCQPVYYSYEMLESELAKVRAQNEGMDKNRNGILLGNPDCELSKTVTHDMWSLYNLLPAGDHQKVHRHNSIALDYCVRASENTYTMIGKKLDAEGNIKDPIRADWVPGAMFVTPPGWWHSHHNESKEDAVVLPVQDAGLHTYVQSLDIQFGHGY